MSQYTPLVDRQPRNDPSGTQQIYRFPNDYGASVIRTQFSYGGESGLFELAVLLFDGEGDGDFAINYETPVTDDVLGYLSEKEVQVLLDNINALQPV